MLSFIHQACNRVSGVQSQDSDEAFGVLHSLLVVLAAQPCDDVWADAEACQLLGQTSIMLVMQLLQQGDGAAADRLLSLLGFRHRLTNSAFQSASLPAQATPAGQPLPFPPPQPQPAPLGRPPTPSPLVVDQALPPYLLSVLQRGFSPGAAFWREHCYWGGPAGFFSYVFPLSDPPGHPVEEAISQLRRCLLESCSAGAAGAAEVAAAVGRATHAEWWVHCREPGAPHQLHFDVDETRLRHGQGSYKLRHPLLGSALFLSGHPSAHGPTLVLDQSPQDLDLAGRAWAVAPASGRYAVFRGDLLHGVMPGKGVSGPTVEDEGISRAPPPRTTLMVAWWEFDADQQGQLAAQRSGQHAQQDSSIHPGAAATSLQRSATLPAEGTCPVGGLGPLQGVHCASGGGGSEEPSASSAIAPMEAAGPMHLPPWRAASGAGVLQRCSWPAEFTCASGGEPWPAGTAAQRQRTEPTVGGAGPAANAQLAVHGSACSSSTGAVQAGEAATRLLQPAWVSISCRACGESGEASQDEGSSSDGEHSSGRSGGSEQCQAAKRARKEGEGRLRGRLPLLYPPLRFFLFDAHDIRAAYVPG